MPLTLGHGPLAAHPAPANYTIDGPKHSIHFEPHPRRIRAELGGVTVLDTTRGSLLHETGILPVFYFPLDELDPALLARTDNVTHCPFKGNASYWTVSAGEHVAENALWAYEDPKPETPWLSGQGALYFDRMDRWLEEDEEIIGHLRDPYARVDVRRSSRPVEITLDGQTVLREASPMLLFETGLGTRAYVSKDGLDLLPSERRTICPYKGHATYWSLRVGDRVLEDAAWSYEQPYEQVAPITGLVSLDHEALEVTIG
jgi:uncharacterized protein (DUF427 family)